MQHKQATFFVLLALLPFLALSQNSLSPYFHVQSEAGPGAFPLLSNKAKAIINGPVADVRITQTYRNDGSAPLEALYVFPASTRAAVYHMEMRIGERVITAQIMEKHKATQTYEAAKEQGKRAGLLEQARPNVFQMHVANILPGEEIEVMLRYTEFIIPEDQVYTFVYPTVVGPRYIGQVEQAAEASFAALPYMPEGHAPSYTFDLDVDLRMPVPIAHLECSSHLTTISQFSDTEVGVRLDPEEIYGGNRDYILHYRLAGDEIVSGVMTYSDGKDNYFLCQVEPPQLTPATRIVPREYIFIIDVSGSMRGFPLDVSKSLMRNLLSNLKATDRFNILCFAGSAFMLHPASIEATPQNIQMALGHLSDMRGGGGTELLPALQRALRAPKHPGYARSFVIATDGYVTVEEEAFQLVHQTLGEANFFAFGIGSGVNRHLIEGLAHVGRGEPFIVTDDNEAYDIADKLRIYIEHPVLTDIQISCSDIDVHGLIPDNIPDLLAARPIYCFGKYTAGDDPTIHITGKSGGKAYMHSVAVPKPSQANTALPYLWAREKIRLLSDFNVVNTTDERIAEITRLGLEYNLLTSYTSFVAVDDEPVVEPGTARSKARQPVPLPQGVTNMAVGFEMTLDILEEPDSVKVMDVDIACANKDMRTVIELVLEQVLLAMDPAKVRSLSGKQFRFDVAPNGTTSTSPEVDPALKLVVAELQRALHDLGVTFPRTETVTISITPLSKH